MNNTATDASKICLVYLVNHLRQQGFQLLDVQFQTAHLSQFGVIEISRDAYKERLQLAMQHKARF